MSTRGSGGLRIPVLQPGGLASFSRCTRSAAQLPCGRPLNICYSHRLGCEARLAVGGGSVAVDLPTSLAQQELGHSQDVSMLRTERMQFVPPFLVLRI